jgi:hypothetical protein
LRRKLKADPTPFAPVPLPRRANRGWSLRFAELERLEAALYAEHEEAMREIEWWAFISGVEQ